MLFPIADENTDRRTTPFVNYVLIGINLLVFVFLQGLGSNEKFTYAYSTVPSGNHQRPRHHRRPIECLSIRSPGKTSKYLACNRRLIPVWFTLITSMFMHGGIAHIFGNMLFLWIFGDNIEDRLGHVRYIIFYLVCGVLASLAHVFTTVALASSEASHADSQSGRVGRDFRRAGRVPAAFSDEDG